MSSDHDAVKEAGDIYGGADPRDVPAYTVRDAARYLHIPRGTLLHWVTGQRYAAADGSRRRRPGVIALALGRPPTLSFWNLVEAFVLASIRRQHGVPLQKVRKAIVYVEREMGLARPLIQGDFHTNGVDLFVSEFGKLVNASRDGQVEMREMLAASLKRIERDPQGLASRMFPWIRRPDEPVEVEIDPRRAFGRLVVRGTGVPTRVIAERLRAGDTLSHLADDYRLSMTQLESALRWELASAQA